MSMFHWSSPSARRKMKQMKFTQRVFGLLIKNPTRDGNPREAKYSRA